MFCHWLGVFRGWIHTGPVTSAHPCTANRGEEEKKTSKSSNEARPLTAGLSAHVWGVNCKRLLPRSPSTHKLNEFYDCDSLLLGFVSWQFLLTTSRSFYFLGLFLSRSHQWFDLLVFSFLNFANFFHLVTCFFPPFSFSTAFPDSKAFYFVSY